jgi:hypothetical protein
MLARVGSWLLASAFLLSCDPDGDGSGASGSGSTGTSGGSSGGGLPCDDDTQGEPYLPGMRKSGTMVNLTLNKAVASPPNKGPERWEVVLTDASDTPIDGATITVTPFMEQHGHGSPVAVGVTADVGVPGGYVFDPIVLNMAGIWTITIDVGLPGDVTDQIELEFCINP